MDNERALELLRDMAAATPEQAAKLYLDWQTEEEDSAAWFQVLGIAVATRKLKNWDEGQELFDRVKRG